MDEEPFTQVIVEVIAFFAVVLVTTEVAATGAATTGAGVVAAIGALWLNLILIVGEEKVKLAALNLIHPSRSLTASVATSEVVPSVDVTLMVACSGALEKP